MSVIPQAVRSTNTDLFGTSMLPVLEELVTSELEQHPSRRDALFKNVAHDRDIWQSTELHDLDLAQEVQEGAEYSFVRPNQGASKTLTIKKMGLGFSISKEMIEDGKFDLVADMAKALARSAKEAQEIDAMNIFNNGFSSEVTNDGLAIFHVSHTLPSGLTFRNRLASDSDLSTTTLDTALVDFRTQFIGDSGIIYNPEPKILLVAPANERYARELIGSELKADTAENNMNSFKADGLRVMVSPHLIDADAWFLVGAPEKTGLRIVNRSPIATSSDMTNGWSTDSIRYKISYREKIGCVHARALLGTPGAG